MMRYLNLVLIVGLLALGGCAASGHNFDSSRLSRLTPGQTTLAEAAHVMTAPPDQIYPQSDGTTLALWRFHLTFVPDGLYSRKQALLQFGPDGRLMRLVDSTNVLLEPWERQKLLGPAPAADLSQDTVSQANRGGMAAALPAPSQ